MKMKVKISLSKGKIKQKVTGDTERISKVERFFARRDLLEHPIKMKRSLYNLRDKIQNARLSTISLMHREAYENEIYKLHEKFAEAGYTFYITNPVGTTVFDQEHFNIIFKRPWLK